MKIVIEPIVSVKEELAAARIRHEVFGREWRCKVTNPVYQVRGEALHLLARLEPNGDPVATLSVVETTGDIDLHSQFGLPFDHEARVARYTQLAVLKRYRGMNIPLALILEARAKFVHPSGFEYTWLLFDAARAGSTSLCKWLGFEPSAKTFDTEYGRMRVLVRAERQGRDVETAHRPEEMVVGR